MGGDKGRGEVGLGAGNEAKYARMPFMHAYDGLGDACLRTGTHRWCDTDSACGRGGARQCLCVLRFDGLRMGCKRTERTYLDTSSIELFRASRIADDEDIPLAKYFSAFAP